MVHTHTHSRPAAANFLRLRQMKWRWRWKGSEVTMGMRWQILNRDTRRGTQKRTGKRKNTNTNTPNPERANPERAREKKKRTDDGPNTNQRRGGGRKRLTQPTRREPKPTSAREGPKPDLEREHAWDRGPINGELVSKKMHPQRHDWFLMRPKGPPISSQNPLNGWSVQHRDIGGVPWPLCLWRPKAFFFK